MPKVDADTVRALIERLRQEPDTPKWCHEAANALSTLLSEREEQDKRIRVLENDAPFAEMGAALNVAIERAEKAEAQAEAMRMALERGKGCIQGLLAGRPVRDVTETMCEIDAAIAQEGKPT